MKSRALTFSADAYKELELPRQQYKTEPITRVLRQAW